MARKKHGAEQIVTILRQIEVELANHKNIVQACKEAGITQQIYYRWRKEYGVTRPATIDLYLAYCETLARWCQHFGLGSVAETETALWTYAEIAKLSDTDAEAAKARREFDEDMWIRRGRAAQVFRPFFRKYGRLQTAQILLDEDPILAGKIAAEEYERLLGMISMRVRNRPLPREKGAPEGLIEELAAKGYIRPEDKPELKRIWLTRNKVVHPSGKRPERAEVEVMIDFIQGICLPWEKLGLKRS